MSHNQLILLYSVMPYITGILLKIIVFFVSSRTQKSAFDKLVDARRPEGVKAALDEGQRGVVLAVLGYSTRTLTGASTMITSLVALLAVALKNHQPWLWWCWGADLFLSAIVWFVIYRLKGPQQQIAKMNVGTFVLILSAMLDILALIVTSLTLPASPSLPPCG